jgi:hypothetical protein
MRARRPAAALFASLFLLGGAADAARAQAGAAFRACGMLTPAEFETGIGLKVTGLAPAPGAVAGAEICNGEAPVGAVMLRLAKKSPGADEKAAKGLEMARKMGAQVEVKISDGATCSTIVPPSALAQYGFNTTCSLEGGGQVAAVEVTARAAKDQVPMERLRALALKMKGRF